MDYDVFNGDADGLCALIQLRLAQPRRAELITGVKRDIGLLRQLEAGAGDRVTVLDISMAKNAPELARILDAGAEVFYVDHHQSGEIPQHRSLQALIDTSASTCTSLLVNDYLGGLYPAWAVTAAFGDNLDASARQLAGAMSLSDVQTDSLRQLGICINYNGYGATIDDLHFAPADLFRKMAHFKSPFDFINEQTEIYHQLVEGYTNDMASAQTVKAELESEQTALFILPDEAWARRVSGVFGNNLANAFPGRAHAVLTRNSANDYTVSVRAPLNNKTGADELCAAFATGGGRKAAAGINHLPEADLNQFIQAFTTRYTV